MRRVILLEHMSLDGFVAGPNGEMDWIRLDDEMWDYGSRLTNTSDAALYGRVTYELMAGYWPTAAEQPGATKHDIDHATWVNAATKYVVSTSLERAPWGTGNDAIVIRDNVADQVAKLKQGPGKNFFLVGSISLAQTLMRHGLIDEYWINVNPFVLGDGKPLFAKTQDKLNLKLIDSKVFGNGVVGVHYEPEL
jgi:dihydrofolate reductase